MIVLVLEDWPGFSPLVVDSRRLSDVFASGSQPILAGPTLDHWCSVGRCASAGAPGCCREVHSLAGQDSGPWPGLRRRLACRLGTVSGRVREEGGDVLRAV